MGIGEILRYTLFNLVHKKLGEKGGGEHQGNPRMLLMLLYREMRDYNLI